ncbi:hypothetical protein DM82_6153 [Burkholderia oklahomensis]|uniref:Uncharacterized protein n=1 Tax=Burkholderia oklahomensis TaxID=342113 RepID=A0AAI8FR75_9BURK|nr:hypothetical protein DM82_6153 [Burkholderia oklahomensis]
MNAPHSRSNPHARYKQIARGPCATPGAAPVGVKTHSAAPRAR